jgi:hypothetical protein
VRVVLVQLVILVIQVHLVTREPVLLQVAMVVPLQPHGQVKQVLLDLLVALATQDQLARVRLLVVMVALLQLTGQVEQARVAHQELQVHQDPLVPEQHLALQVERLLQHGLVRMALLVIQVQLLRQ